MLVEGDGEERRDDDAPVVVVVLVEAIVSGTCRCSPPLPPELGVEHFSRVSPGRPTGRRETMGRGVNGRITAQRVAMGAVFGMCIWNREGVTVYVYQE